MKNWPNNFKNNLWTQEEIDLLYDPDLTIKDMAKITGRTEGAIRKKRNSIRRLYMQSEESKNSAIIGEARVLSLAKKMHVKLLGTIEVKR